MNGTITDVPGVKVGHSIDEKGITGCTAIITEQGAVCSVDVRGSAPGTRETDALDPINSVGAIHALSLAGGSAFGLDAAMGIMRYLQQQDVGVFVEVAKIPIVPGAVIFDLLIGDSKAYATAQMGYEAAANATNAKVESGNVGAGYGALVGKVSGNDYCMKGGLGSSSVKGADDLVVGAIVVVNAVGDVKDPQTRQTIAGGRNRETGEWRDSCAFLKENQIPKVKQNTNTTIGAVALNAKLTKAEAKKIAQLTQNALARTIYPVHTMYDGDSIFVLGTGEKQYPLDYLGQLAIEAMEQAIINAVKFAQPIAGIPSYQSIQ
jgi:L-aminopeptidase/D-esterase-like protein